jgi:hypothetical protein
MDLRPMAGNRDTEKHGFLQEDFLYWILSEALDFS